MGQVIMLAVLGWLAWFGFQFFSVAGTSAFY